LVIRSPIWSMLVPSDTRTLSEMWEHPTYFYGNAQTQIGKKWTGTSRNNATKQINSAPHNQNQNQAERKICDVKRRVMLTLRYSCAPIVFWCFCLQFIVDCLNHTASKKLDWRTPKERHDGTLRTYQCSDFNFGNQFDTTNQLPSTQLRTFFLEDSSASHGTTVMHSLT
jgi:hypothetical protein